VNSKMEGALQIHQLLPFLEGEMEGGWSDSLSKNGRMQGG